MTNLRKYDTDKWLLYVNQTNSSTTLLDDGTYTYQAFVSDASGNHNQTEQRTVTIGDTPPMWFDNSTNSTIAGSYIDHSLRWTDETDLSGYIFSFNNGSNWTDGDCSGYTTESECERWGCTWEPIPIKAGSFSSASSGNIDLNDPAILEGGYLVPFIGVDTDTDSVYTIEVTGVDENTFSWAKFDDGDIAETGTGFYATFPNGTYAINETKDMECQFLTSVAGSSSGTITTLNDYGDTNYAVEMLPTTDDDGNRLNTVSKTSTSFDWAAKDDTGGAELQLTGFYYCVMPYGAYDNSGVVILSGTDTLGSPATTAKTITMPGTMPDANYAVIATSYTSGSADYCEIEIGTKTTTTFDVTGEDDDITNDCASRAFDYIVVPYGDNLINNGIADSCGGTPNYEFKNDSWASLSGTEDWSNVTKFASINADDVIKWRVYANDSSDQWNMSDTFQYTLMAPVTVSLHTPADANHSVPLDRNVTFNCSAYSPDGILSNITLWAASEDTWMEIQTVGITGTWNFSTFSMDPHDHFGENTLKDTEIHWNCIAFDSEGRWAWDWDYNSAWYDYVLSGWDLGTYNQSHFQKTDSEFPPYGVDDGVTNMWDNLILFHFNNDPNYGENSSAGGFVYDFSDWGNDATLGNGSAGTSPLWVPTGKMGGAYWFDGVSDSIRVASPYGLDASYTVSVWVKPSFDWELTGGPDYYRIASTMGSTEWGGGNINLLYNAEWGAVEAYGNGADLYYFTSLEQGQWYHLIVSYYPGGDLVLYFNGWPVAWDYADGSYANETGGDLYIGAGNHGSEEFSEATIDELAVFGSVLDDWDILGLYDRQKDGYPGHAITLTANDTEQELPANQEDTTNTEWGGVNMTGNVALYHFNRDWYLGAYMTGEQHDAYLDDYSGNDNRAYYGYGGNAVSNSGFESGTGTDADSWTEGADAIRASDRAYADTWSMKVTPNEVQATTQASVPVDADTDYTMFAWVYNDLDDVGEINAYVDLNDIAEECDIWSTTGLAEWEFLSCDFTTGGSTTSVEVRMVTDGGDIGSNTGSVWFDEVTVTASMPRYVRDGKLNGAFHFDGANDFAMTDWDNMLDSDWEGTISAWVKAFENDVLFAYSTFDDNDEWIHWWLSDETGSLVQEWADDGVNFPNITGTTPLNDSQWHHIVITADGSSRTRFYVDGVEDYTTYDSDGCGDCEYDWVSDIMDVGTNDNFFEIGAIHDQAADWGYIDALFDEVAVWNRSLSEDEILGIYGRQRGNYISEGSYESSVLDASRTVSWQNMSLGMFHYYHDEGLPYFQAVEPLSGGANMTGNVLLMQFNEDPAYNEESAMPYDYSGNGNTGILHSNDITECESTSGWSTSSTTVGLYSERLQGDYSLNITTYAVDSQAEYWPGPTWDLSGEQYITFWGKSATYSPVEAGFLIFNGSGYDTYYWWWLWFDEDWTLYVLPLDSPDWAEGDVNLSDIQHFTFEFYQDDGSVLVDMVTTSKEPQIEGVFDADGIDDYISVGDNSSLQMTDEVTIGAWVYRNSHDNYELVMGNGGGWGQPGYHMLSMVDGTMRFEINSNALDTRVLNDNHWYYLAFTYDGTDGMRTYVNGELDSENPYTGGIGSTSANFSIGYGLYSGYGGGYFDGYIDDVTVWNRSLSAQEILDIYNRADYIGIAARSCDDPACSGEDWVDLGTNSSLTSLKSLEPNRYFQYYSYYWSPNGDYSPELSTESITIQYDDTPPTTSLDTPTDGNHSVPLTQNVTINCSASAGSYGLSSISLWTDISGTWSLMETKESTGSWNFSVFSVDPLERFGSNTFRDTEVSWNCLAMDSQSQTDWADYNYTFSGWELGSLNISRLTGADPELPSDRANDGVTDMTGNVLLYHLNQDPLYGEDSYYVHDFSGSGSNGAFTPAKISDCESTDDWYTSNSTLEVSQDRMQGSYSLNLTATAPDGYAEYWPGPAWDFSGSRYIEFWAKSGTGSAIEDGEVYILKGDYSAYYQWNFTYPEDWALIRLDLNNPDSTFGSLDLSAVEEFRFDVNTDGNSGLIDMAGSTMDPGKESGYLDGALHFNGESDYIYSGDTAEGTDAITISMWAYRMTYGGAEGLISHTDGEYSTDGWFLSAYDDGRLNLFFENADHYSDYGIAINEWTHVAVTFSDDLDEVSYYKNGQLVETIYAPENIIESSSSLKIGIENSIWTDGFFGGYIDEVALWNRSLTASEILAIYERQRDGHPGQPGHSIALEANDTVQELHDYQADMSPTETLGINMTGNVILLHLDGYGLISGDNVPDTSGLGNNGTLGGSDNALLNPGFESGTGTDADNWTEGDFVTRSSDRARSGTYSMKVTAPTYATGASQASVSVSADTDYILSGWAYNDLDADVNAYLDLNDIEEECTAFSTQGNGAWEHIYCGFTTGPSTTSVEVRLITDGGGIGDNTGDVWFDDLRLTPSMPSWQHTGKLGQAFSFDGNDDYIRVNSLTLTNLTAGFWINLNSLDGWMGLFSKGPYGGTTDWYLTLRDSDDGDACLVLNDITTYCAGSNYLDTGNWHYIAITSAGSDSTSYSWKVYKDGQPWISTSDSNDHSANSYDFCIGSENSGGACGNVPINGSIDEVAVWNRSLTASEIKAIYDRQKGKFIVQGNYTSAIFDAGEAVSWKNITWDEPAPYGEELPDSQAVESLSGGANMTGNVLLLHLNNESAYGENSTHFYDFSGNGNNGTCYDTACSNMTISGMLSNGYFFDGYNDVIYFNGSICDQDFDGVSVSFWYRSNDTTPGDKNQDDEYVLWMSTSSGGIWPMINFHINGWGSGLPQFAIKESWFNSTPGKVTGTTDVVDQQWHHIVGVRTGGGAGSRMRMYVDGVLENDTSDDNGGKTISYYSCAPSDQLFIGGQDNWGDSYVDGTIDEFAIWNRSLSAQEILDIYKRGALRLNLSARSCDDAACSGESWTSLGSNASYTSLASFSMNRYFQYKFDLESFHGDFSPELTTNSVTVQYLPDTTAPAITISSPLNASYNSLPVDLNATTSEPASTCLYNLDGGSNATLSNDSTTNWFIEMSPSEALHHIYVYCNDTFGNMGLNDTIWFTYDATAPLIDFVPDTPTNDSSRSQDWANVNVSITEASDHSAFIDWNYSLVLWWSFEYYNSTGVYDNSTYENFGIFQGNLGTGDITYGKRGNGIGFGDSPEYVRVEDPADGSLDFGAGDFTVSAWIKTSSTTDNRNLFHKGAGAGTYGWRFGINNGVPSILIGNSTDYSAGDIGTASVNDDEWHNLIVVYDRSGNAIGYIDGNEIGTLDISDITGSINNADPLLLRSDTYGGFDGNIDEVMIFNRVLSPEEINASYNARLYLLERNFTGLSDGSYDYQSHVIDAAGNINQTGWNTVTVDTTTPLIEFVPVTPPNASATRNTSIGFNVSITEENLDILKWNWNGTNYTIFNDSLVLMMNFDNVSALGECTVRNQAGCVKDLSGNDNDGTLGDSSSGTDPTWNSTGKYGGAFDFDGVDDYVKIASDISIGEMNQLTIEAWVKTKGSNSTQTIVSKNGPYMLYLHTTNQLICGAYNGSIWVWPSSATSLDNNTWYHVAETYNGSEVQCWINGEKNGNPIELTNVLPENPGAFLFIGNGSQLGSQEQFNGSIDEVRIWNRSLSDSEISQMYMTNLNKYDTDKWLLHVNQSNSSTTGLDEGSYTYYAYVSDSLGSHNQTEERTVAVDTTTPLIDFVPDTPTNGSSRSQDWANVNVSITEASDHSAFIDWNYSLVGYWSMDSYNSSGVFDNSTYSNFGTFGGGLSTSDITYGKRGNAFGFDGVGDYVNVADDNSLNGMDELTIEAWVYPKVPDVGGREGIAVKADVYYFWYGDQKINLYLYNSSGVGFGHVTSTNTLNLNAWSHVVALYDGSQSSNNVKLFINGNLDKTDSWDGGALATSLISTLEIGHYFGQKFFNGTIDEVRIWNRALSPEEINASYNARLYLLERNFTGLSDGSYDYQAHVIDSAGNTNQTGWNTVTIDQTNPSISLESPFNQTYNSLPVDLNATVSEAASTCLYNLNGGTNTTLSSDSSTNWFTEMSPSDGLYHLFVYCNDTAGNFGLNDTIWFTVSTIQLNITSVFDPDPVFAGAQETVDVNTTVQVNQTANNISMVNITDDIPWDFQAPSASEVSVYFVDSSLGTQTEITTNASVYISVDDQGGILPTILRVNISNISLTDAGGYIQAWDSILLTYSITSPVLNGSEYRLLYTNSSVTDIASQQKTDYLLSNLTSSQVLLRGYKDIWIPDLGNPQNLSVEIVFKAYGGPVSGIYISDYLPQGATVKDLSVTLYNSSLGDWVTLVNGSDFYLSLDNPYQTRLPDGIWVDAYNYNFSYQFANWDGNLYNNDTIRILYNITVLGGGEWTLPAIIAGFDPEYQKNIKTEMYASANVPSFDVLLEMLTDSVEPGGVVKALLRILNVGGPRAKVDVFVTYSAKTLQGDLVAERSETLAVVEQKEKSLELPLPDNMPPGTYAFESYVTYTGREALSTGTFVIKGEMEPGLIEEYGLYIFLVAIIMVLALMYFRATRKVKSPSGNTQMGADKGSASPGLALFAMIILLLSLFMPVAAAQITGSLEVLDRTLEQGDEARALFKVRNDDYTGYRTDVLVAYSITDPTGQLIKAESGTYPVSDSRDIVFKLNIPKDALPGIYSFSTSTTYAGGGDTYKDSFQVSGPESPFMLYLITLPIIGMVAGVIIASRRKGG